MNWFQRTFKVGRGQGVKSASINMSYGGSSNFVHVVGTPSAAKQSPTCMSGVNWICQNILEPEVIAETLTTKGWEKIEAAKERLMLTAPVRRSAERAGIIDQSYTQKLQGAAQDLVLEGNAYLIRHGSGTANQVFQWVPAQSVSPVADNGSWSRIASYLVSVGGQSVTFQPEQIIHLRYSVDPDRPSMGLSPIAPIGRALLADAIVGQYMERALAAGGPGLIMRPGKESRVSFENFQAAVNAVKDKIKGENAGSVIGVNEEFDLDKFGYSPEDMALDIMSTHPQTVICSSLGIPPQVLGIQAGQKTSTYSNMEEANKNAARNALIPLWQIIAGAITDQVFASEMSDTRIRFAYEDIQALQENQDARWKRATDAYARGVISREAAQTELGIEATAEGYYSKFDRMPVPLDTLP